MTPLHEDTLYLAMTRPAMFAGLPIEAGMSVLSVCVTLMLLFGNPIYAATIGGFCYLVAKAVVHHDVNMFKLLALWGRTKLRCVNRRHWGGSTFSPTRTVAAKRRDYARANA